MVKTNIARLFRNGPCGCLRVILTVWLPVASTVAMTDLLVEPAELALEVLEGLPALSWFSWLRVLVFFQ